MIGDKDLFDVWDDADPVEVRLALLVRIVAELRTWSTPRRRAEALRLVHKLLVAIDDVGTQADRLRSALENL